MTLCTAILFTILALSASDAKAEDLFKIFKSSFDKGFVQPVSMLGSNNIETNHSSDLELRIDKEFPEIEKYDKNNLMKLVEFSFVNTTTLDKLDKIKITYLGSKYFNSRIESSNIFDDKKNNIRLEAICNTKVYRDNMFVFEINIKDTGNLFSDKNHFFNTYLIIMNELGHMISTQYDLILNSASSYIYRDMMADIISSKYNIQKKDITSWGYVDKFKKAYDVMLALYTKYSDNGIITLESKEKAFEFLNHNNPETILTKVDEILSYLPENRKELVADIMSNSCFKYTTKK